MLLLILGLIVFLGSHTFTMMRGARAAAIARIGLGPYRALYSVISTVGLILVIWGFGRYRANDWVDIWYPPVWTRHLTLLLVWAAFICLASAYLPGRIRTALKHPMLAGIKIWAFAHLLANGDLGSILMFGSILAWAVLARISMKRRYDEVADHGGPLTAPDGWRNDILAIVVGAAAWFIFARWLHPVLIGVPVWPGT